MGLSRWSHHGFLMFFRKTKGIIIRAPLHNFLFPTPFMLTLLVQSDLFKACTYQISFPGILTLFFSVYCSPSPFLKLTVAVSLQSLQQHLTWSSQLLWWSAPSFEKGQELRCAQLHGPCWVLCPLPLAQRCPVTRINICVPKNGDLTPLLGILAGWAALLLP